MVYCQYCGAQNRDGDLRCSNCGKPLSLIQTGPPQKSRFSSNNNQNLRNSFRNSSNQEGSIKSRYIQREQGYQDNPNIPNNQNYQSYQNQQNQRDYQNNRPNQGGRGYNNQQNSLYNQSYQNQQDYQRQQNYQHYQDQQNYPRNREYSNNFNQGELNRQYSQNHINEPKKVSKTTIEWDVVIATALMVIILTAILQRIFPVFAIFISLLLGLAYILVATKSKASLIKSIPLTFFVILAISAYFSL